MAELESEGVNENNGIDENILLNRKVNYSIIRYLWDMLKGYVDNSPWSSNENRISLYDTFSIQRTKYNKIVYTNEIAKLEKTAVKLHKLTGIDKDIFNGKKMFCVENISKEDWKKHFDTFRLRRLIKQGYIKGVEDVDARHKKYIKLANDNKIDIKESVKRLDPILKEFTTELKTKLKNSTYDINQNSDLFLLYYFIKYDKAYTTSISIEMLAEELDTITWDELTSVTGDSLAVFIKALKVKLKLSEAAEILTGKNE